MMSLTVLLISPVASSWSWVRVVRANLVGTKQLRTRVAWLCACALMFSGCAATVPMAIGSLDTEAKRLTPPPGRANVYIFRGSGIGKALAFQVILDGKIVGSVAPDTYHLVVVDPGDHAVAASSNENSKLVRFRAEPGKNYFFEVEVKMGWRSGRVGLEQVDEKEGRKGVLEANRAESM